jgi:hypothetical protein
MGRTGRIDLGQAPSHPAIALQFHPAELDRIFLSARSDAALLPSGDPP